MQIREGLSAAIVTLAAANLLFYTLALFLSPYTLSITFNLSNLTRDYVIDRLTMYIFATSITVPLLMPVSLSTIIHTLTAVYLLLLLYSLFREKNVVSALKALGWRDNDSLSYVSYSSLCFLLVLLVGEVQSRMGVKTGYMVAVNEYVRFSSSFIAPLIEEVGFRLSIIGVAAVAFYWPDRRSIASLVKVLWRPYRAYVETNSKPLLTLLYSILVVTSVIFGLSHYLSKSGWDVGKITTATISGLILGYLYIKHGFHSAVLGHAFFNVYLLSLTYLETLIGQLFIVLILLSLTLGALVLVEALINALARPASLTL